MKGRQVILGRLWGAEAAALVVDGRLEDLLVDTATLLPLAPGAICRGVVDRLVKGQGGVFLRLPDGASGYLRDRSGLREGQPLLVQVSGVAEPGKAVPLTTRLLFRGRHGIVTPDAPGVNVSRSIRDEDERARLTALGEAALAGGNADHGMILRSASTFAGPDEVAEELCALATLAAAVTADMAGGPELLLDAPGPWEAAWRDWADPAPDAVDDSDDSFASSGAEAAVDALLAPEIRFPGGGHAAIESTRALVAVDVNTGRDTSPAASLKANIALARDLPRCGRLTAGQANFSLMRADLPERSRR